ncbi:MAG: hypothetical protein A2Z25_01610 [Planctomycetes bacterium RBG_16_55_9]|nr:MAG: hypothetical protein A2Z25_01610 [Planctomycetes bacterium RBG_16_55_9]
MIEILAIIVNGHWRPGIGDPTVLGWVTTAGYLIAAGLCGAYALRADSVIGTMRFNWHRVFWWGLAIAMLLMGLNKQLDLQVLLIRVARRMSKVQGWHAERYVVYKWFVMGIASAGLILTGWLGWTCRHGLRQCALALCGVGLLVLFAVIRACGGAVEIQGWRPGNFPMRWILEIGGIACIAVSALMGLHRCRKSYRLKESKSPV